MWFLEFEAGDERRYRFVCSSRNLTNDRTWDAVISLDGKPAMQPNDRRRNLNHSSASLLRWLSQPGRTSPRLSADRSARIERLATSWESVEWERPEHARKMRTHVLGIGVNSAPKPRGTRTLIVSPFVTAEGIQQLRSGENVDTTILSRPEQLDRLSPVTLTELTTFVLDDFVDRELVGGQSDAASNTALSGLHAKVVVRDLTKTKSSLMIGSANATGPAWSANVEVMVEVEGPADRLGVDAIAKSLAPLIEEYEATGGDEPSEEEVAERALDAALRSLASSRLALRVRDEGPYTLNVWADASPEMPAGFHLSWRLITQSDDVPGVFPSASTPHEFAGLALSETLRSSSPRCRMTPDTLRGAS